MPLDLNTCLFLDFEARSELDITEVGAHAYAEHSSTEILCCGWALGLEMEVQIWRPGEERPWQWMELGEHWVAHNKDTERMLLKHKLGIHIDSAWWIDTASVTSAAGMPRNLHDVAESLKLDIQKQSRTAMLALARPRKLAKAELRCCHSCGWFIAHGREWKRDECEWCRALNVRFWSHEEKPELFAEMEDYCRRDVDLMRKALVRLPPYQWVMPPKEERIAVLTDKMNDLGVEVDIEAVHIASDVVKAHNAELRAEFATIVPGVNPRYSKGVSAALGMANSKKETVRDELAEEPADSPRHRALTVLKSIKLASVAKLEAFKKHTCVDRRVHGAMVFHGAGRTGRFSSMGVQLHNMMRGLGVSGPDWAAVDSSPDAMDIYFAALHSGILDLCYPDVSRATAAAMRGFLLNSETGLLMGDFSQIEARTLVSWACQEDMVLAFRAKRDPYKMLAARIYNKPLEAVTKDERFMGKIGVLGAGYGLGRFGLMAMLKVQFNVVISEEEAQHIVTTYRTSNPRVVALWYAVERLAKQVILTKPERLISSTDVPRIGMRMVKDWLVVRLPSGRCLWYFEPELVSDGGTKQDIVYWGRDVKRGGRWSRVKTYGGKLVENITQAVARDAMTEAMLRLDEAGFALNMTVHDEIVAPGPAERLPEFESIMRQPPTWWPDLPLDVEVQHKTRYQK